MKLNQVEAQLKDYPTLHDLLRGRIAIILLVGGLVGGRFYFGAWKNPMTDFAVWSPVAFGVAALFSQIVWRTMFSNFSAREFPLLSAIVFLASFILVGLVIG